MTPADYWREAVTESFDSHGITASAAQIDSIANDMAVSHENFPMMFPSGPPDRSRDDEAAILKQKLKEEQSKRGCPDCSGRGHTVSAGYGRESYYDCNRCHGSGKILPGD